MTIATARSPRLRVSESVPAPGPRPSRAEQIKASVPGATEPLSRFLAEILGSDGRSKPSRGVPFDAAKKVRGRARALHGQLAIGQVLVGFAGRYLIRSLTRRGDHSDTYLAAVVSRARGSSVPDRGHLVVLKIPRVQDDMTDAGAADRLRILVGLFTAEVAALERLSSVQGIARIVDRGRYNHRLQAVSKPSIFVVQEYIEGEDLVPYFESRYGKGGRFVGLPSAKEFFYWARRVAKIVDDIHKHLVVHGHIWPGNIRVNAKQEPVLVDFGEGLFAQVMDDESRLMHPAARYLAPERGRGVGGDLYAVGGVFHYFAAGDEPPRPYENIETLKQQVEANICRNNEALLRENSGVVDIVARCLRYSHKGRVENAAQLLRDIDTFDVTSISLSVGKEIRTLTRFARQVDRSGHELLGWVAVMQARELAARLENIAQGVYDLTAGPDTIRGTVADLMSVLAAGDEFVSIALPKFWRSENIGINGRFLSKTKEAVQRGVKVRRVFLIDKTLVERELDLIIAAQQRVAIELGYSADFSVRFLLLEAKVIDQLVREGKHFGLFVRRGSPTAFFPQYRADDTLETLRFRTDPAIVSGLRDTFNTLYEDRRTKPLADLSLPSVRVS